MKRHIDDRVMHEHLGKHVIHLVFMVTMLVAFKMVNFPVSTMSFMALVLGSIAMLEAGLWIIRRRESGARSH